MVPLFTGEKTELERDTLYWHYPHYHRTKPCGAIRDGDMKLIEFFEDGKLELYDLSNDPNEADNLSSSKPEIAKALLEKLRTWRKSVDAQMMTENPNYDPTVGKKNNRNKKPKK